MLGVLDGVEEYNNAGALLGLDAVDNEELLGALRRMNPIQRMRTITDAQGRQPVSRAGNLLKRTRTNEIAVESNRADGSHRSHDHHVLFGKHRRRWQYPIGLCGLCINKSIGEEELFFWGNNHHQRIRDNTIITLLTDFRGSLFVLSNEYRLGCRQKSRCSKIAGKILSCRESADFRTAQKHLRAVKSSEHTEFISAPT